MGAVTAVFKCGECGHWHSDEDDARECCAPMPIDGWRCDLCKYSYLQKVEAEACCVFKCSECGTRNGASDEVCKFCGHDQASDPIPQAVLEAAGQQRLVL